MHYLVPALCQCQRQEGKKPMAKRILLVDDEPLIIKGLKYTLEQEGFEIDSASDGEEALEKFFAGQFDFILLVEIIGILNTGLIVLIIGLVDVIGKEIRGGSGTVLQIRLHVGEIIGGKRSCHRQNAYQSQRKHHAGRVQKPAFLQTTQIQKGFFLHRPYAPHL